MSNTPDPYGELTDDDKRYLAWRREQERLGARLVWAREHGEALASPAPTAPVYLKMAEAKRHTRLSKKVLLRLAKIGEVEAVKHGDSANCHLHFNRDSLDRYMAAHHPN